VGGHTHLPMVRRYAAGHLVNPGSVGLPGVGPTSPHLSLSRDVRWAEYAVIGMEGGRLAIELRRTPLDLSAMFAAAHQSGMRPLAWGRQRWAPVPEHPYPAAGRPAPRAPPLAQTWASTCSASRFPSRTL